MEDRDKFIETIAHFGGKFGLNPALSRIYALLYWEGTPLSLDEIKNILKISKGNVSINIRKLEEWGAVEKVWRKGSNKHYYRVKEDFKTFLPRRVKETLQKRLDILLNHLREIEDSLEDKEKLAKLKNLKQTLGRAREALTWFEEGVKSIL